MDPTPHRLNGLTSTRLRFQQSVMLATVLFTSLIISGCTHSSSSYASCKTQLALEWADTEQLHADIAKLTSPKFEGRKTGTSGAELTRQYIDLRYREIGLTPWKGKYSAPFTYQYSFGERRGINMIGVIYAPEPTDKWRVILAHYDHLGMKGNKIHPGADDNASGVAALLQVASQIAKHNKIGYAGLPDSSQSPVNTLFVATDAEEPGLFGGYALVEQLKELGTIPQIEQIELAINMDMVGRPGRPYVIYLEGRRGFTHFNDIKRTLTTATGLCIKANHPSPLGRSVLKVDWLRASDHYPLHKAGVPWLYFGVPPHKDYHGSGDTVEKIDLKFLAAVSESVYQLLIIDSLTLK
ncbi:Peptidase family M28 [Shewanella psychrophila]|uniref:Peptidase family M28 n=1 Tax=Shewanella psychrophila TaxID=225848 RepID=A0A1S6HRD8_9GAMM|nr:M28 family peptidase [Shewanella psychrophila]AQS38085.1 Peptidase family M28 [Shewanella psychrophila]